MQRSQLSASQRDRPQENIVTTLSLDFEPLELQENNPVFKPPQLWYFVIAALVDNYMWKIQKS